MVGDGMMLWLMASCSEHGAGRHEYGKQPY